MKDENKHYMRKIRAQRCLMMVQRGVSTDTAGTHSSAVTGDMSLVLHTGSVCEGYTRLTPRPKHTNHNRHHSLYYILLILIDSDNQASPENFSDFISPSVTVNRSTETDCLHMDAGCFQPSAMFFFSTVEPLAHLLPTSTLSFSSQ